MKYRSLEEMETTISFCRTEKDVHVWTSDTCMYTKLDKLCLTAPDFYQCTEVARDRDGDTLSKSYTITDKSLLSFRSGKIKREYTEEQRTATTERLKRARQTRNVPYLSSTDTQVKAE